jgi:hypothetical protein
MDTSATGRHVGHARSTDGTSIAYESAGRRAGRRPGGRSDRRRLGERAARPGAGRSLTQTVGSSEALCPSTMSGPALK